MTFQFVPASEEELARRGIGVKAPVEAPVATTRQRARTQKGHFVPDDKGTPDVNEAWVKKPKSKE
jgi:hypothetical protein